MIVVDTNTIAYLYLNNENTQVVKQLLEKNAHWIAPLLWRSEMRDILALYMRKNILNINLAQQIQTKAEALMAGREYTVDSVSILSLANATGCSAYDCEFIALAHSQSVPQITPDKKILSRFSNTALKPNTYMQIYH